MKAAFGRGERELGRGENGHGRVRGKRGGTWRRAGDPGDEREKQEVAEDVAVACVVPGFSSAYWQEVEDEAAPGGLGRQVGWLAGLCQVSSGKSSCLFFSFSIFMFCFDLNLATVSKLKTISEQCQHPLNNFMLQNGHFQMHIKCFKVFENIFYTYYEYNSKCK